VIDIYVVVAFRGRAMDGGELLSFPIGTGKQAFLVLVDD
jgi:hypothetical protein